MEKTIDEIHEKENVLVDMLNDIENLIIEKNFEKARLLLEKFPATENNTVVYLLNLAKGVMELNDGNYYDSLKCLDAALNSPVLDTDSEKFSYINGLLHRSTVNHRINHKEQQNADIRKAIDYAKESKLLGVTEVREKFTSIVKGAPLLELTEDTIYYLRKNLEPYSILDVALSIKKNTIW